MAKEIFARWQSRGGKTWIELSEDEWGFSYRGNDCGGNLGKLASRAAAIEEMDKRIRDYLTPDAHKNLLKRVR